jgi:lipid II:glycine glycyltransferase (peptidoglycan interpeptide bridge formation enzyme)
MEIDSFCQRHKSILLKVEPDSWCTPDKNEPNLPPNGFRNSRHSIQPSRTIVVDLKGDESSVLGRMKQKTRYNIRLASKKGVVVRESADIHLFHRLVVETSERDQFGVHNLEYYRRAYSLFQARGECEIFIAEYEGMPLAGIMVFLHGERAWYFYGASSNKHRDLMPNYKLQWEAMRWARGQGCSEYDLWGVPDEDLEDLEGQFMKRSDDLWGVYRFKRGFGGEVRRSQGPWDRVYNPILYKVYELRVSKLGD